jgi:DNA polymerase III epsilon subunit-like protein
MSWWDGRLVGLDLETTSTEPEDARIVTAALALCGGGEPTGAQAWLADPGVEIPAEAAEVHGVTTERARAEGMPVGAVLVPMLAMISEARRCGWPLVIFNARYDLTVLDRECRRHGVAMPELGYVIDPLVVDKWLDRFRPGSRKLDAICAQYGARLDAAHDASSDALAACRAAWVLGAKGRVIRNIRHWNVAQDTAELAELQREWAEVREDLAKLHAAQTRWAYDQAVGLAQYFREQGNPDADRVETNWPLVPARVAA